MATIQALRHSLSSKPDESDSKHACVFLGLLATVNAFQLTPVVQLKKAPAAVSMETKLDKAMKNWIRQTSARDNGREEHFVSEDQVYSSMRRMRDEKLAQDDTRAFCLDRCLATGYCDVLEDLLEMTTKQVQRFCDE